MPRLSWRRAGRRHSGDPAGSRLLAVPSRRFPFPGPASNLQPPKLTVRAPGRGVCVAPGLGRSRGACGAGGRQSGGSGCSGQPPEVWRPRPGLGSHCPGPRVTCLGGGGGEGCSGGNVASKVGRTGSRAGLRNWDQGSPQRNASGSQACLPELELGAVCFD